MTLLVGQNGNGWTIIGANPWGTGGNAIYYKNGYTAIAGAMATINVTVQATASATLATVYVYSGTGVGASFVAMSAEFSVSTTGAKTAAISGVLSAGPYTLVLQTPSGSFQVAVNSGSSASADNQNNLASFPYRSPPGTIPAVTVNSGQEFIIWIDGAVSGGGTLPLLFAPFQPLYGPNSGPNAGTLVSSLTISASTTAASGVLPGNTQLNDFNQIRIANTASDWAYVNFGRNTTEIAAATVATGYPVAPGGVVVVTVTSEVAAVSVILASSTGSVIFTRGTTP